MQLEMMRLLKEMRELRPSVDGDALGGNEWHGLRVARNLSRMRVMKEQVLRTRDDLKAKVLKSTPEQASEEGEQLEGREGDKKKVKGEKQG